MLSKLSKGNKISGAASAIACVCFFMPWVLVSCEQQPVASFTGWQLASGGTVSSALGPLPLQGSPEIFLVLLSSIAALALIYMVYRSQLDLRRASYGLIGVAVVSLFLMLTKFLGAESRATAEAGVEVSVRLRFGFWGVVLANIATITGAVMNLRAGQAPAVQPTYMATSPQPAAAPPSLTQAAPHPVQSPLVTRRLDAEPVEAAQTCPHCGAANAAGYRFCSSCGGAITGA
jgi:hypothetical protein